MNPREVFLIAKVFQNKSEKYPKMKIAFERASTFLRENVCDFAKIEQTFTLSWPKSSIYHHYIPHQC